MYQSQSGGPLSSFSPRSRKYPGFGWSRVSLKQQLPTRVDSLFFKKRREKRMQIFSNWHEDRGMEVVSSLFFQRQGRSKNLQSVICSVSEAQILQISQQQSILRQARSVLNLPKAFDKKLLVLPEQNVTHSFVCYIFYLLA